ncbi:MAG: histidine triad nucleotide-binding protein [Pseudomonadales bacterium]
MSDSIFSKIMAGDIPAEIIYQDEHCIAIHDIQPQAPVHVLVISRKVIPRLVEAEAEDQALLGHLLLAVGKVAQQLGISDAFRTVINNGAGAGQTVFHLHIHVLGGDTFAEGQMAP